MIFVGTSLGWFCLKMFATQFSNEFGMTHIAVALHDLLDSLIWRCFVRRLWLTDEMQMLRYLRHATYADQIF